MLGLSRYRNRNQKTDHTKTKTKTETETDTKITKTFYFSSEELFNTWLDRALTTKSEFKLKFYTNYLY